MKNFNLPAPNIWALSTLGCVCLIPLLISPLMLGILVDTGYMTDSEAGYTIGVGGIGAVLIAIVCALSMHHLPLQRLAKAGLILAACSNLGSAFFYEQQNVLYGVRLVAAFGDGACFAAIMSFFARQSQSERCYGLFMMLQFGLAAGALYAIPTFVPDLNVTQMYLGMTALNLLAFPLTRLLPNTAALAEGISIEASEWKLLATIPAIAGLGALLFFEISNTGSAAYMERIAVLAELSDGDIGIAFGTASLMGVPGGLAILWLGSRFGHAKPVLAGALVGAIGVVFVFQIESFAGFLVCIYLINFTWAFTLPYLQSVLADQDRGGAVVTAGGIASGAGGGIGPALTGTLVTSTDYSGVLVIGLAGYLGCALFVMLAAYFSSRNQFVSP